MTILTHKQQAARYDKVSMFFDGKDSAHILTDKVGGVISSSVVPIDRTEPYAFGTRTLVETGTGITAMQLPKKGLLMGVVKSQSVMLLSTIDIGISSGAEVGILLGEASCALNTGAETPTTLTRTTSATGGDYMLMAVAWDDENANYYYGEDKNDATLAATTAITAAQSAELPANFSDAIRISAVNVMHIFGIVLMDWTTDGLPSDLLVGMNDMQADWYAGDKKIYSAWEPNA